MKLPPLLRTSLILLIVVCNIGCDQISKNIVRQELDYNENISFISNHLTVTKVENTGAFLSLGHALPFAIKFTLLSLLPILALLGGVYFLLTRTNISRAFITGASFVIGGGIGNLYDRILYGSITDFLHIDFILFQTGIFNMADVSIMVGVAIILIEMNRNKLKFPVVD